MKQAVQLSSLVPYSFESHDCLLSSLDPSNARVREGMERVEKHGDLGMDSTYDVEVEDNTDNEVKESKFTALCWLLFFVFDNIHSYSVAMTTCTVPMCFHKASI